MKKYDLVVIGGGPAGIVGATQAASSGKKVAVVDLHPELGGAGINTGTVPSKTLRETALALSGVRSRDLYGVDLSLRRETTVADFLRHERTVRAGFNHLVAIRFAVDQIETYKGTAMFTDPHTIQIAGSDSSETTIQGDKILIATGSSPVLPDIFPFTSREVYDSDTILELDRVPKKMAIVGAGAIGSEYACTFAALGATVHLIDGRDQLLPYLDAELSRTLMTGMEKLGIIFHWNEKVQACASTEQGVTLTFASGQTLTADSVLVAAGRQSNTGKLNLAAAGIEPAERGLIKVNEH
jgi:NAD(P) transhydrogenase